MGSKAFNYKIIREMFIFILIHIWKIENLTNQQLYFFENIEISPLD